jgi:hypothetical protein
MNRPPPPPIALSAVFIVNLRGDVLIERQYRSDISRANIDMFKTEILSLSASSSSPFSGRKSSNGSSKRNASTTSSKVDVQSLPPIRIVGQIRFMFIRVANVYVCAATKLNVNVSMCFAFLKSAIGTFQVRGVFSLSRAHVAREKKSNLRGALVVCFVLLCGYLCVHVCALDEVTDAFFLSLSFSLFV